MAKSIGRPTVAKEMPNKRLWFSLSNYLLLNEIRVET